LKFPNSALEKQSILFEQRLFETQNLARIGSWDWNVLTNVVQWSEMMFLLLGYEPNEITPSYSIAYNHVHDDDKAVYEKTIDTCLKEKSTYFLKNRIVLDDGTVMFVISRGKCVLDEKGNLIRMIGTIQDISEQIIAEQNVIDKEKALERDRLKSQFIANVSHEIRNPLNAILGFSQLLRNPDLTDYDKENYLDLISSSGTILKSIISNTLDISKIEANELHIVFAPCNLNEIMKNLHTQFNNSNSNSEVTITLSNALADNESSINTDSNRLIQILSNLLENAQKFTKKGSIYFGYTVSQSLIHFFVTDSGKGIDTKHTDIIFQRFRQVDRQALNSGIGLGLSICKKLVALLGGTIEVDSEIDKGATFNFTIVYNKINSTTINGKTLNIHPKNDTSKVTILVAEDNEKNSKYLDIILKAENYAVIHARNGEEAVKLAEEEKSIALIIMDIRMPIMDGITASILIRKMNPTIPIIMQSGHIDEYVQKQIMDIGCNAFIAKPFSESELFEIIEKELEKSTTYK
jgi:two-component system CheB/CheR fusion protein